MLGCVATKEPSSEVVFLRDKLSHALISSSEVIKKTVLLNESLTVIIFLNCTSEYINYVKIRISHRIL